MAARVKLRRPLERAISSGHPWIYADALEPVRGLAAGAEVLVHTRNDRPMARGLYDPGSPIAVRVYTLDAKQPLDAAFVRGRLARALALRRPAFGADTDAWRWCNGEGDLLPGIVVDRYGPVAVVRVDGAAARALVPHVGPALLAVAAEAGLEIRHVYERSRGGVGAVITGGEPPALVPIVEHGMRLQVDVLRGQKTGFFLDQRENRQRVRSWARGLRVANLFCYTGGFSLAAALGGATRVTSVDLAVPAVEAARHHFADNGLDPAAHDFQAIDAFDWLKAAQDRGDRYELVVTDPPSFAPSEQALPAAVAAYRDLNAAALALVPDGGTLCAASCSSHVDLEAFLGALGEAARAVRRPLAVLEAHGQPLDHPTPPGFPEGRYLKFVRCRVG